MLQGAKALAGAAAGIGRGGSDARRCGAGQRRHTPPPSLGSAQAPPAAATSRQQTCGPSEESEKTISIMGNCSVIMIWIIICCFVLYQHGNFMELVHSSPENTLPSQLWRSSWSFYWMPAHFNTTDTVSVTSSLARPYLDIMVSWNLDPSTCCCPDGTCGWSDPSYKDMAIYEPVDNNSVNSGWQPWASILLYLSS